MGQAKQRGTPEQRRAEAEQREAELNVARKAHLAQLEESEKHSDKMVEAYTVQMLRAFFDKTSHEKLSRTQREKPIAITLAAE
jgi:hypothetical protein